MVCCQMEMNALKIMEAEPGGFYFRWVLVEGFSGEMTIE